MVWNDGRRDLTVVRRIVAMLFLLADLADLATMANRRTRWRVLEILYQAEILARRFVAGAVLDFWAAPLQVSPPEPVFLPCGGHPADAADLAVRLRAFALVLAHVVLLAGQSARRAQTAKNAAELQRWRKIRAGRELPVPLIFDRLAQSLLAAIRAPPRHRFAVR